MEVSRGRAPPPPRALVPSPRLAPHSLPPTGLPPRGRERKASLAPRWPDHTLASAPGHPCPAPRPCWNLDPSL